MQTAKEMLDAMKSELEASEGSMNAILNENTHTTYKRSPILKMQISPKYSHWYAVPLTVRVPFNPFTGKVDERFTDVTPFRHLTSSPTKWLTMMIEHFKENPDVLLLYKRHAKSFLVEQAHRDAIDALDFTSENLNFRSSAMLDFMAPFRAAFSDSRPVTKLQEKNTRSGDMMPVTYILDTKQDQTTGQFLAPFGQGHRLAALSGAMRYAEQQSFSDAVTSTTTPKFPQTMSYSLGRSFMNEETFTAVTKTEGIKFLDMLGKIGETHKATRPAMQINTFAYQFPSMERSGEITELDADDQPLLMDFYKELPASFDPYKISLQKSKKALEGIELVIGNYIASDVSRRNLRNRTADLSMDFAIISRFTTSTDAEWTNLQWQEEGSKDFETSKAVIFNTKTRDYEYPEMKAWFEALEEHAWDIMGNPEKAKQLQADMFSMFRPLSDTHVEQMERAITEAYRPDSPIYTNQIKEEHMPLLIELFPDHFMDDAEKLMKENPDADLDQLEADSFSAEAKAQVESPEALPMDDVDDEVETVD